MSASTGEMGVASECLVGVTGAGVIGVRDETLVVCAVDVVGETGSLAGLVAEGVCAG